MFYRDLGNGFQIREASSAELKVVLEEHHQRIYKNRQEWQIFSEQAFDDNEKINSRRNQQRAYHLRLIMYSGSKVVGWHYGFSTDPETYYMQNSAILEQYRKQGHYGRLLEVVLQKLREEEFQVITSTHHPSNAAVLIPKLKKGFILSSMLIHEKFRVLVELKYFFNEDRRKNFSKNLGLDLL